MISRSELISMAKSVRGAYGDFILGTYIEAKSTDNVEKVFQYMKFTEGVSQAMCVSF